MNRKKWTIGMAVLVIAIAAVGWYLNRNTFHFDSEIHSPQAAKVFATLDPVEASPVDGFPFTLELRSESQPGHSSHGHFHDLRNHYPDLRIARIRLHMSGFSLKKIRAKAPHGEVKTKVSQGPGFIDILATEEKSRTLAMADFGGPNWQSAKSFHFLLNPIWLPPDRPVYLRIRFKDSTELFGLGCDRNGNLQVAPIECRYGQAASRSIDDTTHKANTKTRSIKFHALECKEGDSTFQCNPVGLFATQKDELLWSRQLSLQGQPTGIQVVGNYLFVTTSARHSFYCKKTDGDLLFYAEEILAGKDPVAEILALAQRTKDHELLRTIEVTLPRFIDALVEFQDQRAIPFLIACLDTHEKAMVIAGLEKFHGNPIYWGIRMKDPERDRRTLDSERFTFHGLQAERAKWRKAFNVAPK